MRLWDLEALSPLGRPFIGHQERVTGVVFADDNTVFSTGHDGTVLRWDLNVDNWIAQACAISNRNLTPIEWSQFLRDRDYALTCG